MRLVITGEARADLRDIARHIGRNNPERAKTYVDQLIAKMEAAAKQPRIYSVREVGGRELRAAHYGKYLIFFRLEEDVVRVVRVLHGARDIASLFRT